MFSFDTINEMVEIVVCGEPQGDEMFEVYSTQKGETVFEGTWEQLLESPYVDIPLASFDIASREGFIMCFNLSDEDWDYDDEEEDEDEDGEDDEDEEERSAVWDGDSPVVTFGSAEDDPRSVLFDNEDDSDDDEDEDDCECPLGGDEHDDCADCAYACDYHFVNGECVKRKKEEE